MAFEDLQKPVGTIDLLLYLHGHGKANVTTAVSETGMNRETFYGAVDRLVSLGFAYREEPYGFPRTVNVGLTHAGEAMARALGPAADLLAATTLSMERELARLREGGDPATVPRRMEILDLTADREFALGRWERAEAAARELLDLARASKDSHREAQGRLGLGRILQKRDRHADAVRELEEALRLANGAGDPGTASEAEYLIGADLERQGRFADALGRYATAADRAARGPDALRAARARQAQARLQSKMGRHEESVAGLTEVVREFERLRAEEDLPRAYTSLGIAAYGLDRPDAIAWLEKGIDAAIRAGDVRLEAYGRLNAAAPLIDAREFRRAQAYLVRAREVFGALEERTGLGAAELNTANLYSREDRWTDAEDAFDRAIALARETGNRNQEAYALFNRGQMAKRRGLRGEARALLTQAKAIFTEIGAAGRATRCDEELADLTR